MKPMSIRFSILVVALGALLALPASGARATTVHRPLSDFLSAQGTTSIFVPPVPDFLGFSDPQSGLCASVDYASLAAGWLLDQGVDLGTTIDGTVSERPLADGRALVTVDLHVDNALVWVIEDCDSFATSPLLFGARAQDVADGVAPALGQVHFKVSFTIAAPGDPLPDLITALFFDTPEGFELRSLAVRANADGYLSADGAPARAVVSETGLFMTGFHGAVGDGFPVELIAVHPTG